MEHRTIRPVGYFLFNGIKFHIFFFKFNIISGYIIINAIQFGHTYKPDEIQTMETKVSCVLRVCDLLDY